MLGDSIFDNAQYALALFNGVILYEAVMQGIPVFDLRLVCTEPANYAASSPIEPSFEDGRKIAAAIAQLVPALNACMARTVIFSAAASQLERTT
ncbi:hypothetical protein GJV26_16770 [Massilia dura]|uniref:Uncharacterized protein n=1 Tax=Pseudoduganella dura TaxID=321982 RepID=A0A6I3XCH9_9BURK|nr:hypothetical protein [Pseudoduganella dura]MUI14097.1 hypothetical protein [Pseudoduganella dura]